MLLVWLVAENQGLETAQRLDVVGLPEGETVLAVGALPPLYEGKRHGLTRQVRMGLLLENVGQRILVLLSPRQIGLRRALLPTHSLAATRTHGLERTINSLAAIHCFPGYSDVFLIQIDNQLSSIS